MPDAGWKAGWLFRGALVDASSSELLLVREFRELLLTRLEVLVGSKTPTASAIATATTTRAARSELGSVPFVPRARNYDLIQRLALSPSPRAVHALCIPLVVLMS